MKRGGCLLFIFLQTCLSLEQSPTPLDYENICKHHFSLGCPVHDGDSWRCAKFLTNCPGDQPNRYHCILNSTGEPFQVIHRCAPLSKCDKGTIPIYNKRKDVVSCEPCRNGYYQPYNTWSDETPECFRKHACEKEENKIECDMGTELRNTQDAYCRCDARKNYILTNFEVRGKCVPWEYATCYYHSCPDGQERLLNYSCASLCPLGQKRDDNDICVLIGFVSQTTAYINGNSTMSVTGKGTPKTTITTTLTSTYEQSTRDSNVASIIASAVIVPVILIVLLIVVCWKWNLIKNCMSVMNSRRTRRQLRTDAGTASELMNITQDTDANGAAQRGTHLGERTDEDNEANGAAQRATHQGERTNDGSGPVVYHHHEVNIYANAEIIQFGDNSQITKVSAQQPKTPEDSSSSSSRHSSDSQLADSLPPQNSSQGDIFEDKDASLPTNFLVDIESENTEPKRISDGTDSSETRRAVKNI